MLKDSSHIISFIHFSQNSRTYNAKIPLESKLLRRDRDSGGRSEKPPNPSVFSPLAVKVTGGNSVSSQGQPSADAVSTLASLPVQRLSNRENVPSAEKPIDPTENLVGRVLADAEAFCKPFKHFKSLCMNCPNSSAENGNPLCVKGKYNAPFDFSLKRVSPLPEFTFGSERPVEESIPPLTKKRRRSSNEINSLPVESACKNRTIEPLQKTEAEESKRSRESKWIIPTVAPNDLKLRLLSAVSAQLSSSSITDKLSAFRFLIKGLRVPGNINDTMVGGRRPLTAALVFHKKDKSFRRFVDCGTVTSPKRIATSSTQYDLKRQADFIAQTSPPSVTSVFTNTSPSQRASAAINTDPVRLENGLSNDSSFEYCLKKVLRRNSREVERTIYGYVFFATFFYIFCFILTESGKPGWQISNLLLFLQFRLLLSSSPIMVTVSSHPRLHAYHSYFQFAEQYRGRAVNTGQHFRQRSLKLLECIGEVCDSDVLFGYCHPHTSIRLFVYAGRAASHT